MAAADDNLSTEDRRRCVGVSPIIARIFPIHSQFLDISQSVARFQMTEDPFSHLILIGNRSSRQNLLFQAATSYTVEGSCVCYIRPHPLDVLPSSVHGMNQPNSTCAHRLKMLYLPTIQALIDYLSNIHQEAAPPDVLILDDLTFYTSHSMEDDQCRTLSKLCALLLDSAHFLQTKSDQSRARLVVGTEAAAANSSHILPLFFNNIFTIQDVGKSRFRMSTMESSESRTVIDKKECPPPTFFFNLKESQIFLEEIS